MNFEAVEIDDGAAVLVFGQGIEQSSSAVATSSVYRDGDPIRHDVSPETFIMEKLPDCRHRILVAPSQLFPKSLPSGSLLDS